MTTFSLTRRHFLKGSAVTGSGLVVSGCDALDFLSDRDNQVRRALESANSLTYRVQRLLLRGDQLAQEFSEADIRQPMRPNGVTRPDDANYANSLSDNFTDFRLKVAGLVDKPLMLSLDQLRAMPSRTQITRHDCVEGWSCIAKWTGVRLAFLLDQARPKPEARFVVFRCFDTIERSLSGEVKYYESIGLVDARHPQTILAYGMNDGPLPVENGAPLRVRVERQLGYKMAKYIHAVDVVDSLAPYGEGRGGYWEDRGYEWYAGI